jgi:hypothetical protein
MVSRSPDLCMTQIADEESIFLALRLKHDNSGMAEMFVARVHSPTCQGLPVCKIADVPPIATQIKAERVLEMLGPPTHQSYGSTDQCWVLNAAGFAKVSAEFDKVRSIHERAATRAAAALWPQPAKSREPHYQSSSFQCSSGMLTRYHDFL